MVELEKKDLGVNTNVNLSIYDETLIHSLVLIDMKGADPIERMGQVKWFKRLVKENIYCIALDPSAGTGGDYALITVSNCPNGASSRMAKQ